MMTQSLCPLLMSDTASGDVLANMKSGSVICA
jgi:hypothetical protein